MLSIVFLTVITLNCFTLYILLVQTALAQPYVIDSALRVEPAVDGLSSPTGMAFLDDNNLLVLERGGNVRLVSNGVLQEQPILQVPVKQEGERGLLGIAVVNNSGGGAVDNVVADVLLYFTEADPLRNRVYKYQWNGQSLINPTLILDLPAEPGPIHNGGKMVIGPDGYLYVFIGDVNHIGQLQNIRDGPLPDDTGVIIRVNPHDGSAAPDNPFANSDNGLLSKYYAYGIRNSFGMDFDPLSNNLWDTENGPEGFDEINLVRPGFNSGWVGITGPISMWGGPAVEDEVLVDFPGSNYSDPLLSWRDPVAPTDIEFFTSSKLGDNYTNNIFVGDINKGNLYFFEVNQSRDGIIFDSQQESGLSDHIVDTKIIKGTVYISEEELSSITFGSGFGGITDIETGPDGLLYVLSFGDGIIYKISRSIDTIEKMDAVHKQRIPTMRYTDEPYTHQFSIAGVDNDTGYVVSWVTANNVTRALGQNASEVALVQNSTYAKEGFIEMLVSLPNGTIPIGDKYKACVAVPKYMYQVCDKGFNEPSKPWEITTVTLPNLNGTTNPAHAPRIQTLENAQFTTMFSIAGVDNDTGDILTWTTANNETGVSFYNATLYDWRSERQDGFLQTFITLPNGTMHIGDKYKACIKVLKDDNLICKEGINWPTDRAEWNSFILP